MEEERNNNVRAVVRCDSFNPDNVDTCGDCFGNCSRSIALWCWEKTLEDCRFLPGSTICHTRCAQLANLAVTLRLEKVFRRSEPDNMESIW